MNISSKTIKFNVSHTLSSLISREADNIGLSTGDFLRMLAGLYFSTGKPLQKKSPDELLLQQAKEEIARGQFRDFSSVAEFRSFFLNK